MDGRMAGRLGSWSERGVAVERGGCRVDRQSRLQDSESGLNKSGETLLFGLLGTKDGQEQVPVALAALAERVEYRSQTGRRCGLQ